MPIETINEIGASGLRVPILAKLNHVIERLNELSEAENARRQRQIEGI